MEMEVCLVASHDNAKEVYLNSLLTQLKVNEEHQRNQESLLLEIYLADIHSKNLSCYQFKEFITLFIDETTARLDVIIQSNRTSDWFQEGMSYNLKRSAFRQLGRNLKFLYCVLRDSLQLEQHKCLQKYEYLSLEAKSFDIVKQAASFLKKEDYFWIIVLQFGFKKTSYWNQLYDAVFESVSSSLANSSMPGTFAKDHPLLNVIETNLAMKVNSVTLTKEMRISIVQILKEYFALDNPFNRTAEGSLMTAAISTLSVIEKTEGSIKTAAAVSPIVVIENIGAIEGAPIADVLSHTAAFVPTGAVEISPIAAAVSPPIRDVRQQQCGKRISELLSLLKRNKTSKLGNSTGISVQPQRSKRASTNNPVPYLTEILKETKISAKDALAFFENKKHFMTTNEVRPHAVFSSFDEDDLISGRGIKSFSATNESRSLEAGFCTCIVHAIRLLCLCTTATNRNFQNVLKIMANDMKKNSPWEVDEVMSGLKLSVSAEPASKASVSAEPAVKTSVSAQMVDVDDVDEDEDVNEDEDNDVHENELIVSKTDAMWNTLMNTLENTYEQLDQPSSKPPASLSQPASKATVSAKPITFQSLSQSFANVIEQSTYLGALSWTEMATTVQLIEKVKDLYHSNAATTEKNMLFISFSENPAESEFVLPYVFRVHDRNFKDYKGKVVDFSSDSSKDDTVTFQTVGMIYSCSEIETPASYTFRFITYSRCIEDGQYVVHEHVPVPDGKVSQVHKVSHTLEKNKRPETLRVVLQESGHSLVGLILIRNSNQNSAKYLCLNSEIIRSIPNPTNSDNSDACRITCESLRILNGKDWLNDILVQAISHLMFSSLFSKKGRFGMNIRLRSSLDFETFYITLPNSKDGCPPRRMKSVETMLRNSQYIIYLVNVDNGHWICLCISMESKRIFSLDSMNSYTTCRDKANLVIEALKKNFDIDLQWVHLRSPSQRDGNSCGIFAALNAAFMLQSILEGSFTEEGPATLEKWSRKEFSEEDKANIRRCAKDVIYGVEDGAALLNWIN